MLLSLSTSMCFAAASDSNQSVPVHMSVAQTAIDVSVPEKITMTAAANKADLTITPYTVKNNSAIGTIKVDSLKATAETGWTIAKDSTDFTGLAANSKQFSLMHGTHDFGTTPTESLTSGNTATPGKTATFALTGKTGIVTTAVTDVNVAKVVATLGYK